MPSLSAAADVLSAFLKPCRLECRHVQPWRLSSPWGLEFSNAGPGFAVVTEGVCLLRVPGMAADMTLRRNDFAVFTRASGFAICDRPGSRLADGDHLLDNGAMASRDSVYLGGGGAVTRLSWGSLGVTDDYTRQAFSLLPPLLLACADGPDAPGVGPLVRILLDELESRRPGAEALADRVLHALFGYALRGTPLTLPGSDRLIPALNVPGMGLALAAIHSRPNQEWSVRELADLAGLSRSKFAARFVEVFGCPPFDYLRDVRMRLACQLLKESEQGIREICARVGYATEASFSRAFSQWCGSAPGAFRRQKRAPQPGRDGSDRRTAEAAAPASREEFQN
ncbi:MAG: helix-turn-helix domain-containing protein [Deltaproteobacteria bacterium]